MSKNKKTAPMTLDEAILDVLSGCRHDPYDDKRLRTLVTEFGEYSCTGIEAKLHEARAAAPGRFENFIGELQLARAVARHLRVPVRFNVGDAADAEFSIEGSTCLLEIAHLSAPSAYSAVFHPTDEDLHRYANGSRWQQACVALKGLLDTLAIAVQPWIAASFLQPQQGHKARGDQEEACGQLALWLMERLPKALEAGQTELRYTDGKTYFELSSIEAAPGFMKGHGGVEAWIDEGDTLHQVIERKSAKAARRLDATGAAAYVIGLVVDDPWHSSGMELETTLLGPLIHRESAVGARSYRAVPLQRLARFKDALALGRSECLHLAQFDSNENRTWQLAEGLFLDPAYDRVAGVIAIYYTGELQFIANPFCRDDPEPLRRGFPAQVRPFAPA